MATSQVLTEKDRSIAVIFDALGDLNRFRLFRLLLRRDDFCVSELAGELGLSVPAVSQQLKILETSGLVRRERRGQMICYKVMKQGKVVSKILNQL